MLKRLYRSARSLLPSSVRNGFERSFYWGLKRLPIRKRLAIAHFKSHGHWPNLTSPETFSERCQALKIASPDLTRYIDKVLVKDHVRAAIGEAHVIPTLYSGLQLPPRGLRNWPMPYVIKTNHDSGGIVFVRSNPDWDAIEAKVSAHLAFDYGTASDEAFYSRIERKVMVEPFMGPADVLPLDYKYFMFDGECQFIQVDTDRETAHKRAFFTDQWERLPVVNVFPMEHRDIPRPPALEKMNEIAARLSKGHPFVRVDLYDIGGAVYFGELTFTPGAGLLRFEPFAVDAEMGEKWGAAEARLAG